MKNKKYQSSRRASHGLLLKKICVLAVLCQVVLVILIMIMLGFGPARAATSQPFLPYTGRPSCTVAAGAGTGTYTSRSQLQEKQPETINRLRTIKVSVNCAPARIVKLRVGSLPRKNIYSQGRKRGVMRIRAFNAQLDGSPVELQRLNSACRSVGMAEDTQILSPGEILMPVKSSLPVHGKQMTVLLEIARIQGEQNRRSPQLTYPDASINFSLVP